MNKLIIIFFISLTCIDTFGMKKEIPKKGEFKTNIKKDAAKGLIALAFAGLCGYLSLKSSEKSYLAKIQYSKAQEFTYNLYKGTVGKLVDLLPESRLKNYIYNEITIVGNAILAFICAKYGILKFLSIARSKKHKQIKQKASFIIKDSLVN